jgi:mersacidin/lichenicidin family type 2 lantibiotic
MSNVDVIRAWKDEAYRLSLSDAERAALPANPAGLIELHEADLEAVAGGAHPHHTHHHRCGGGGGNGTGGGTGTGTGTGGNCTKCKPKCG